MGRHNRSFNFFLHLEKAVLKGLRTALCLLYPPRCLVCDSFSDEPICAACFSRLKFIKPPMCSICGKPYDELAKAAPVCLDCRKTNRWFDWCRCAVVYDDVAKHMVHRLKYSGDRRLAPQMAKLMAATLTQVMNLCRNEFESHFNLIVPVPLHRSRLRKRGFNQAYLIAEALSEHMGVPVNASLLIRTRDTKPQFDLEPEERLVNVRGAFDLAKPDEVADKTVIIVDDVITTGATLNECAKALRKGKPKMVCAIAFARTVGE